MNIEKTDNTRKIKRRNFFIYLGASVLGFVTFSRFPLSIIRSNTPRKNYSKQKIRVYENPYAVKREGVEKNG
jgi:hypothetical protein